MLNFSARLKIPTRAHEVAGSQSGTSVNDKLMIARQAQNGSYLIFLMLIVNLLNPTHPIHTFFHPLKINAQ
jgi:hypothetical protein